MIIVREVTPQDLDALWELIGQANTGMTSLNIDKEQLSDRVERSHFSFQRTSEKPEGSPYVFVMEDCATNRLVGTSCIFSKTGGFEPFYSYRVVVEPVHSELLNQYYETRSLHLEKIHNGPTEIGSLFLLPEFRGLGVGKLLSLSRFAYMAQHPKRFAPRTIAEMRGFLDEENQSPFWNAIGSHFFRTDFPHADSLSMVDKQFIEDLMPRYPIYLDLLPQQAVQAIGRVHRQTEPALAMLEEQGFRRNTMIDIFDGGPIVECQTQEIQAIKRSMVVRVVKQDEAEASSSRQSIERCVLARCKKPFVAIQCDAIVAEELIFLGDELRDVLGVEYGDSVRIIGGIKG